jgi:hypothetical protein
MANNTNKVESFALEAAGLKDTLSSLGIPSGSEQSSYTGYNEPSKSVLLDWSNPDAVGSTIRKTNIPAGAEPQEKVITQAVFQSREYRDVTSDWRVRLSLPSLSTFRTSPLLQPLTETDNSMIFPTVPNVVIANTASYSMLNLVHTNYAYPVYENSQIDQMNIAGSFPVQSVEEGQYWIACVHYLRSMTKMFYGETSNKGAPPPVVKLNGYGDFVFNNVPVVITNFTVDLAPNVDYIKVPLRTTSSATSDFSYVPVDSSISVTLLPTYSRTKVSSFNFDSFVNGDLRDQGFI